ncbi:hypothetical protein A3759_09805 [Thalassolituus sp. HI0120]|nr:hypothetical protein A3759_20020 [Thalassolituus sp. HI0120]KZZ45430.1 hypothetical protein A3759_09805 [Thalassolituus sp. HI0120]
MKTLIKRLILGLVLFSSASVSGAQAVPLAHISSPEYYHVLLENEHVLVLKMVLQPGESDMSHRHHNETVYFPKGGQLTITEENGESFVANVLDGHVMGHEAWAHQVSNTGDTEVVAIIVESKVSHHEQ